MERIKDYYPQAPLRQFGGSVAIASAQLVAVVDDVIARLEALDGQTLHTPVAVGKWTPLGVADHLNRVTEFYAYSMNRVRKGGEPIRTEKGFIGADGGLIVDIPEVLPGENLELSGVVAALRGSTQKLIDAAFAAESEGLAGTVVNMNPFFGELTPLGTVQMAALHARHHIGKHLSAAG